MSTIFTKIINGEIPCYKIAENDDYFAFLDINPMAKGHTLVVTKAEVDYIINLTEEQTKGLFAFARRIALALKKKWFLAKQLAFLYLELMCRIPTCILYLLTLLKMLISKKTCTKTFKRRI